MGPIRTPPSRYYRTPSRTPYHVARQLFNSGAKTVGKAAAAYVAKKMVDAATQTATSSKTANTNFVTSQYDTTRQYRYRRMPRRKRRRWVKKVKQNAAMDYALAGTRTAVYNGNLEMPIRTGQSQGLIACHLYGHNGDEQIINGLAWEFAQKDINYLIDQDPKIITTGTKLSKFRFTSALCDLTIRNSSLNNLSLEVDLYVIKYTSETDQKSLMAFHQDAITRVANMDSNPLTNPLSLEKRGVTPFDIPSLASMGLKIHTKQKFFLPAGNTFTYQYRDPRNHAFGLGKRYDNDGYILPYQTVTIMCLFKPVVGGTISDARLTLGATRTYRYGIIGQNELAGNFFG